MCIKHAENLSLEYYSGCYCLDPALHNLKKFNLQVVLTSDLIGLTVLHIGTCHFFCVWGEVNFEGGNGKKADSIKGDQSLAEI